MKSLSTAATNIFFSSGTTGNAKMIEHSQASMGMGDRGAKMYATNQCYVFVRPIFITETPLYKSLEPNSLNLSGGKSFECLEHGKCFTAHLLQSFFTTFYHLDESFRRTKVITRLCVIIIAVRPIDKLLY